MTSLHSHRDTGQYSTLHQTLHVSTELRKCTRATTKTKSGRTEINQEIMTFWNILVLDTQTKHELISTIVQPHVCVSLESFRLDWSDLVIGGGTTDCLSPHHCPLSLHPDWPWMNIYPPWERMTNKPTAHPVLSLQFSHKTDSFWPDARRQYWPWRAELRSCVSPINSNCIVCID